jgi:hypothetical protein
MRFHVIAAYRWIAAHRYELTLSAGLFFAFALLIVATPVLLAIALIEARYANNSRRRSRPLGVISVIALANAVRWLWDELHDAPHHPWHACAQCGWPIEEPSRASYCSHQCRQLAQLERRALDSNPAIAARAARRLRNLRLRELVDSDPQLQEVPF